MNAWPKARSSSRILNPGPHIIMPLEAAAGSPGLIVFSLSAHRKSEFNIERWPALKDIQISFAYWGGARRGWGWNYTGKIEEE